ncbi:hypothetical protein K402DRAFT_450787 [Aulographum hederae CBS 113979]|uniref:Uncharacterized protein n=1 Tax=Aulographum hederae CBS 113979 TaxID=1176131 RepID=A0A6G1HD48_9PEZI|nr:hypothetical protein K402DRAFT_450787 [Aulographum hederae CBS 113979]
MSTAPSNAPTLASKAGSTASSTTPKKDDVEKKLRDLDLRTKAVNTNNIARVENSHLISADDKLHVLYSLKTNKPIERFPATPKDITKLTDTLVDAMLLALEADRTGSKEAKIEIEGANWVESESGVNSSVIL